MLMMTSGANAYRGNRTFNVAKIAYEVSKAEPLPPKQAAGPL